MYNEMVVVVYVCSLTLAQDNALRHNSRLPNRPLHFRHAGPNLPTPPAPRRRHDRLFHPARPLHHRRHRDRHPTLRACWQYQRQVPVIRLWAEEPLYGAEFGHAGVAAAECYVSELVGCFCVLDYWGRVSYLDDCAREYGC